MRLEHLELSKKSSVKVFLFYLEKGGSISNMYGITLARYKKHPDLKEKGLFGCKEMVIFTSDMSHYSIQKAAAFMGFGINQVVKVASDENGRMISAELKNSIQKVKQEGREPFFVNATSGTTVFGAFDPLDEIARICEDEGLWLHVDVSIIYYFINKNLLLTIF
ncbi:hypothetical protein Avbf_12715 [Armadillidium vulgare]|nr:hypothetical protein Avbf_12715 [Armadillidium vulgare]